MRNKPLIMQIAPYLFFSIALGFPLQIYYLYNITNPIQIMSMLTPLNILLILMYVLLAIQSITLSKHIYKFVPLTVILTMVNNLYLLKHGQNFTTHQLLTPVLLLIGFGLLYRDEVITIIYNRNTRWWQPAKRLRIKKSVKIYFEDKSIYAQSLNISKSGICTELEDNPLWGEFKLGSEIEISFMSKKLIRMKARIVRKQEDTSIIALEFIHDRRYYQSFLPWMQRKLARS